MIISVENSLTFLPQTLNSFTAANLLSGGTAITIKNPNSFVNQYAVQVGQTGQEQSEIALIGAPTATLLPIASSGTLLYDHPLDTPVYNIRYNKIIILRSTAGTAGTASAIATTNITPDSSLTEYNDTSGASSYAYKTQFYNSLSGDLSAESDWFVPGGNSFYSLGRLRERIRQALYNSSYITNDNIVNDWVNEWLQEMNNAAIKVNQAYAMGSADYAYGTAGFGTVTDSGFKQAIKIQITQDGNSWQNSTEIPMNQYQEWEYFSGNYPRHAWQGNTIFRILPFGAAGTARFSFGEITDNLTDDNDELPLPLRAYTTGCIEYGLYRFYDNDQKAPDAERHYAKYMAKKGDFVSEMTPRDQTGVKFIQTAESLSGLNDDIAIGSEWWG